MPHATIPTSEWLNRRSSSPCTKYAKSGAIDPVTRHVASRWMRATSVAQCPAATAFAAHRRPQSCSRRRREAGATGSRRRGSCERPSRADRRRANRSCEARSRVPDSRDRPLSAEGRGCFRARQCAAGAGGPSVCRAVSLERAKDQRKAGKTAAKTVLIAAVKSCVGRRTSYCPPPNLTARWAHSNGICRGPWTIHAQQGSHCG